MIYTLILKPKFRNTIRVLAFVILVAFSATLYSCQTVYTENYTPEKLKTDDDVKILEVTSKNDSTTNLEEYNVTHHKKYKDSSGVLLIEKTNTPFSKYLGQPIYKLRKSLAEINLNDIKNVKVEKSEFSLGNTMILAGVLMIIGILIYNLANPPDAWRW